MQPPMPSSPIERGRPGPGLLAQVLVAKFCDHTPLHRQAGIYAREGVELDRSTLADWVGRSVFLLAPLAEAVGRHVRAGQVLHADDTTVPVLAPGTGKTRPAGCGWSSGTNVRSLDRTFRRPPTIATRRTARASTPRRCSAAAAASFMPMATPASIALVGSPRRTASRR